MKVRMLTADERDALIEAGLDPVYCEVPEGPQSEAVRNRLFERRMNMWIAKEIYKLNPAETPDFVIGQIGRDTIRLTVLGEEETTKNS